MDIIQDIHAVKNDALSHYNKFPEKFLQMAEKEKKQKYLEAFLWKCHHFYPLVSSMDGIPGVEADAKLKRISTRLASKWKQPYCRTCGYVKSRVAITLVRATHRCIRGSRLTSYNISAQQLQWECSADIHLFQ